MQPRQCQSSMAQMASKKDAQEKTKEKGGKSEKKEEKMGIKS